jgi:tRNA pseudouridine55 synthase
MASQCITVAELEALTEQARETRLLPVDALLDGHTPVTLAPEDAGRFLSGVRRRGSWPDCTHTAVYGQTPHALLGTAHVTAGELIPGRLLSPIEIQSILEKALA